MASLMDIGRSAVNAQREALNVTGQNIANIKTEGYRRREADLTEVIGSQSELVAKTSQSGLGVQLGEIRRAFSSYLTASARSSSSRFEAADAFESKMVQLENLLLPRAGDLGTMMNAFFGELSAIAALPGDMSPRAAALEQGKTLAASFNTTAGVLDDLADSALGQLEANVSEVNLLTSSLAQVNGRLRSSNLGGTPPNALLDERDRLIDELSERLNVTVVTGERFEAEVRIGNSDLGPTLVMGEEATSLTSVLTDEKAIKYKLGMNTFISNVDGGAVKGLHDAYSATMSAVSDLDALARKVVTGLNDQHQQGIDLEGELGIAMFTSAGFDLQPNVRNRGNSTAELNMFPGPIDTFNYVEFSYSKSNNMWEGRDGDGVSVGVGREKIQFAGGMLNISGTPQDGDSIVLSRQSGDASRMSFLLTRAEQFAAASTLKVSAGAGNEGIATLETSVAKTKPSGLDPITEVLKNHLSPVAATDFIRDGVMAVIPAGVDSIELASLKTQPSMQIATPDISKLQSVSFTLDGTTHSFDLNAADVGRTKWRHGSEIATLLNTGAIKSTVTLATALSGMTAGVGSKFNVLTPTSGNLSATLDGVTISGSPAYSNATEFVAAVNEDAALNVKGLSAVVNADGSISLGGNFVANAKTSLKDLGVFASGFNGGLVLASGNLDINGVAKPFTDATFKLTTGGSLKAETAAAKPASDVQIFTREGRQIAGNPMTAAEAAVLLTPLNGFVSDAEYRADYLTAFDGVGYRGMSIDAFKSDGLNRLELGVSTLGSTRASSPLLAQATEAKKAMPKNNTNAQTITVAAINGVQRSITIPAGVAADYVSDELSAQLSPLGINVSAQTRAVLDVPTLTSGSVGFDLSGDNISPFSIVSSITKGDLSGLADAINYRRDDTGITATLTNDSKRLVLDHASGSDIFISNIAAGSVGMDISVLDSDFQPMKKVELNLNSAGSASTPTNINVGTGTASNELTMASTSGSLTIDIEGVNITATGSTTLNTGAANFATAVNANASLSAIGIRAIASTDGSGKVELLSNIQSLTHNTRVSGQISFTSKSGFSLQSNLDLTKTNTALPDQNMGGLVGRDFAIAGSSASLTFASNGEIDGAATNVDGTKSQAPSASYSVSLDATGGPFEVLVNSGETGEPTSERIAAVVASKMRVQAPVPSITGVPIATLPAIGSFSRFSLDGAEYSLERDSTGLKISGPEEGRLVLNTENVYSGATSASGEKVLLGQSITLSVIGGSLSGRAPTPKFDANASLFGFGVASTFTSGATILSSVDPKITHKAQSVLQGRDFTLPSVGGSKTMTAAVKGFDIGITLQSNMPTATTNITVGTGANYNVLTADDTAATTSLSATILGTSVPVTVAAAAGATTTSAEMDARSTALAAAINAKEGVGYDGDGVMAARLVSAGVLPILDGTFSNAGNTHAGFASAREVTISSSSDESGVNFTVTGTDLDGKTLIETIKGASPTAATANAVSVSASATVTGSNDLALVGGTVTLTSGRQITITSAGNDSGKTFTITGTNIAGDVISETITGANADTATSTKYFKTVTEIDPSATPAAATSAGVGNKEITDVTRVVSTVGKFLTVRQVSSSAGTTDKVSLGINLLKATATTNGSGNVALSGDVVSLATNETLGATQSATLSTPSAVVITTNEDLSTKTFTITGTDTNGATLTETIAGTTTGSTLTSGGLFKTVTNVTLADTATGVLATSASSFNVGLAGATSGIFSGLEDTKTGVSTAASRGSAGNLVINGTFSNAGNTAASFNNPREVTITSVSDESGVNFTVTGTDLDGNALVETIAGGAASSMVSTTGKFLTVSQVATSAATTGNVSVGANMTFLGSIPFKTGNILLSNGSVVGNVGGSTSRTDVSTAASRGSAGNLVINGVLSNGGNTVASFTDPREVTIYSVSSESGVNFTITGTGADGNSLTEVIAGGAATSTVSTRSKFLTVSQVATSAATTGNVSVGAKAANLVTHVSGTTLKLTPTTASSSTSASIAIEGVMITVTDIQLANFVATAASPNGDTSIAADVVTKANNYANRFAIAINENIELAAKGLSAVASINGSGEVSVRRLAASLTPASKPVSIQLQADLSNGPINIKGSTAATSLGFKVAEANLLVTNNGLTANSTDGHAVEISGAGSSLAESRLKLTGLPKEELIVVIAGGGARRVSAEYTIDDSVSVDPLKDENAYEVKMIDAASGRVELFDKATGHSIATRISSGNVQFDADGIQFNLNGHSMTGDTFQILTGQKSAGDARNMDDIMGLAVSQVGRSSFQDDFRSIAAAVGSTLESSRLSKLSAEAVRDAAVAAEDEVSGVNMDEEAGKLITQQQAYQAAARILQTAKEMFDTLMRI